jgi:hypothetical protein
MHVMRSTVPDGRAVKALHNRTIEIARSVIGGETKSKAHESANKVEEAIRRWRADIA